MNYRELPFVAISIAIMAVTLLTVIYMPHVGALLITTTTIHTSTTIYTSTTVTVTSTNSSAVTTITTTVIATSTTITTQTVTSATTVRNNVTSTTIVTTVTETKTATTVTETKTATSTTVVYSAVSTTWLTTTATTMVTVSTTATTVVSATATTTVTKTSTSTVYTATTTVNATATSTTATTITSTVTGTEYLYKNTTSVTFVVARSVTTMIPITQYVNTTVVKYNTTQTILYSMSNYVTVMNTTYVVLSSTAYVTMRMSNYVTVMNTTYVVLSSTAYVTMSGTLSLSGYYTIYVTPTVVAVRTVSASATRTTTITVTNNVTQLAVYLRNLEKMDVTLTLNGTATTTTVYVVRETAIILGTATHFLRLINSTTYITITNFYNITYVKGTRVSTMYVSASTTTVSYTRYARATIYGTSYIINGTVVVTSTVAPRIQGFTMNVSGAFLSAAFYISVGPQAYANVFYLNPSTAVALLGNYTPVNATMYVVYNGTTLATVTAGEVSTIYSAPPNVTAYVTAPSYTGTFFVYDANQSPISYLSDYEDLAYIAFVIGVGMLSNLFFRGNRLHAIIGMISVAILGGIVGYAFGIPLAYTSMATVVLVISAAILAIVEKNRETVIGE